MYSRVLKRKVRSPYLDITRAEVPYARQAMRMAEEREFQEKSASDRLALSREAMELQDAQAKKAFGIGVAQTGLVGGYTAHKMGGAGALAMPGEVGAQTALAEGISAPTLTGASEAAGGASAPAGGASGGLVSTLTTPAAGAKLSPLGAAGGALAIEGAHRMLKPMIPKIAEAMPGGESEWKHGMKIGTRAGQGAAFGSAVPIVGTAAGTLFGAGIGALETAWPAIETAAEDTWDFISDTAEDVWDFVSDPCIIITAATDPYSYEVNVTREYRDRYLSQQTLRGYYMVAGKIVPRMYKSKRFKKFIKKHLVDHIVKHCEWGIGLRKKKPVRSSLITTTFLSFCDFIGSTVRQFVRPSGEVW